ncbi:MAG: radical SAM protein [Deltaproteobacteria bacterium RBG_13_52_11]|nr:MAG: radical SAM protein [Deltaproteobacteria bacterium RBG_13_52_11]
MKYEGAIYRPPSEADSLILQITVGCSHNSCTFCPSYKDKRFRIKTFEEIKEDIDEAAQSGWTTERVFLADGDSLIIPQARLMEIMDYLFEKLPRLRRVGIYANAKGILKKTVEDLRELKEAGLGIIYLGVESGDQVVLDRVRKGTTYEKLVQVGRKVKESGIKLSVTVLLGIGGRERSREHAIATGQILTEMDPDYVGALSLIVVPGTPLYEEIAQGRFVLPTPFELIEELRTMIAHTDMHGLFFSNHASNYLPIKARMPKDKEATLKLIDEVLAKRDPALLRPEYFRAL